LNINNYIMFHCHSEYSLLDSCTKFSDYVDLAVKNGQRALSISEHGKPLNWTEKWAACKSAGVKYIHSVEIYLTESLENKVRDNYHTVLMARNMDGVRELNKLISLSCDKEHFYYTNRISFDEFLNTSSNIISTSACLASPLNKLPKSHPRYMELARKYNFLEIQPHNCQEQIDFNKRLLLLSREIGTPLIAGTDTHSSSKYKAECRSILLKAKHKSYGDEDAFDLTYKTYDKLVEAFEKQNAVPKAEYLQAIENTNLLYDLTDDIDLDTSIKYPILYGSREADSDKFEKVVQEKLQDKLDKGIIPESQEEAFKTAIDEEMRVFKKLGMMGFMLSMSELICWCKDQGMAIGTARGSVGGSRVAYVSDIIDLNPETWHTVFSRFCNEDRKEIGDIDIDCVETDRPAIFNYITERFGGRKTARVASFGTIQSKGVIDDVGRSLSIEWNSLHPNREKENPWSLSNIARIKTEFDNSPEETKAKYPELFYYYDGLIDTKISQSVHPAGMVISPITLDDNFGVFDKDGENCLMLDMENIHDFTGLAKYDFLILKTVQIIRDTCNYIGVPYPKTHEIDWCDKEVWLNMIKSPVGLFQFESGYAYDCLRKFKPQNIFDLSLATASIRPSGASYRDDLLAHKIHKNPSDLIDKLLERNNGFLVYQEDIIAFLQQICGLSGSEADNVRRAIGRKQKDRLEAAMPSILNGYCEKSPLPKDKAEAEAKEFLRIIEDASSYMFGMNHSIAYCLLSYLCAYFRCYYPIEFITSYLNNAANEDDINNGTTYASKVGIKVTMPKWGFSKGDYFFDKDKNIISKGLSSVKYIGSNVAEELYQISRQSKFDSFVDVLYSFENSAINSRQLDILIKIDFFSEFGNQRELLRISEIFNDMFKKGTAKQIKREKIDGTVFEEIVKAHSSCKTKTGGESKSYTLLDTPAILKEIEKKILSLGLDDLSDVIKVRNFADAMGYVGYVSGKEQDRRKLYITDVYPLIRKKDNKQFGYSVLTKSIGSGVESRFTLLNRFYNEKPLKKDDIIYLKGWERDGVYFRMLSYEKLN
jgi:DNA polymerase III subunit alpha